MQAADCSTNASSRDIPAAVPELIEAAVAAFDVDRENSRRYLLRASALLVVKRRSGTAVSPRRSGAGLLVWEVNRVVDYIETHLGDKITAQELANLLDTRVGRLFRAFKVSVGISPLRYVALRRVELVCTMLIKTREPLCQLALACGLSDQSHLCKVFRRAIGMSPSAFRRAMTAPYAACARPPHAFSNSPPTIRAGGDLR